LRTTLSNITHRAITVLEPIYDAQLRHVLLSRILAIDETPIKAGRKEKGKMRVGWYWPIYGLDNKVAFTFSYSRGSKHLHSTLNGFSGTVLSDGHSAYRSYAKAVIGALYRVEAHIRDKKMNLVEALAGRAEHAKPAVDAFFAWCEAQCQRMDLVPSSPLSKALKYARSRDAQLPPVPGRPGTTLGHQSSATHLARHSDGKKVVVILLDRGRRSARRHHSKPAHHLPAAQRDPHIYLTDVLQRVALHPASRVEELTPRAWKTMFVDNPMHSDVYRPDVNNGPL
jgi:transposase